MARVGLRLLLRKQQAEAGDIALLFADESEALTHPYLARAWAPRGADLRVPAPGQARKIAMLGVLDHIRRDLVVTTARTKRSADFIALLEMLDGLYGPKPGQTNKPVVLILDNGPIHTSKLTRTALAAREHWLTVEWLPKSAPELNDIEGAWRDLKAHHLSRFRKSGYRFCGKNLRQNKSLSGRSVGLPTQVCLAHRTFTDLDDLDTAIHRAVEELNTKRTRHPLAKPRISA